MKKNNPLIFIHFMVFMACTSSQPQTYKLSDEELAHLMFDIHFADVILPELPGEQQDSIKVIFWKRMMETYHLTREEIQEEIDKLETEPEKLKMIIGRVKEMADSIQ